MPTFKKYKPKIEKELHTIIENELDALEEGLELLKYEMGIATGVPDFLCVDSGGRIVIIEVKLQEDEHVLFQALRYYNEVDKNRYVIAQLFSNKNVNPQEHARIIIIAERFSDDIRRMATLLVPDVELYEYTVLIDSDNKKGIVFHPVSLPKLEENISEPPSIQKLINYITNEELHEIIEQIIEKLKNIDSEIVEYPTSGYIGFKYKGRQIAWIGPYRKAFDFGAHIIDDKGHVVDYESIRIEDKNEDYSEIVDKVKESYENLKNRNS